MWSHYTNQRAIIDILGHTNVVTVRAHQVLRNGFGKDINIQMMNY